MGLQVRQGGQWLDVILVGQGANPVTLFDSGPVDHVLAQVSTSAPITDTTTYRSATVTASNRDGTGRVLIDAAAGQMKGRGNGTWAAPKKPYKLKLGTAAPLLGMPASKSWALMADYWDDAHLRTKVAYEIGRRATGRWLPRSYWVELTMNGTFAGLYELMETVEVDTGRLGIRKMKDTDTTDLPLTGPYLMQIDQGSLNDAHFTTARGTSIYYDTPDVVNVPAQASYLASSFDTFETAIIAGDYSNADLPSLADWILMQELFGNTDACWYRSCKFYKDQDTASAQGKVVFWSPWDFDQSWNNGNDGATFGQARGYDTWYVASYTPSTSSDYPRWPAIIYQGSASFRGAVRARWDTAWKPAAQGIPALMDTINDNIAAALARDRQAWFDGQTISTRSTPADMKSWMASRVAWLDAHL